MTVRPFDEALLRQAFAVAKRARETGDHPFGSVLADGDGALLMEQGNGFTSEGRDRTAHAERLLASRASRAYDLAFLRRCTLYTSAEPCAMCAGAIYWAGIGRVVYGQSERGLKEQTGAHEENPTLDLPCDLVFKAGQRPTEVVGPLLEDEAAALQADFWSARNRGRRDLEPPYGILATAINNFSGLQVLLTTGCAAYNTNVVGREYGRRLSVW